MAARVAAELEKDEGIEVDRRTGGLGEFSVFIDEQKVVDTSRFWYPAPGKVVAKVRTLLAG